MKINPLIDNIIKFTFPFLALLVSYYLFEITDFIKPLYEIKKDNIKWAINLAFNTSLINIFYELLKEVLSPQIIYSINIHDRKEQNNITLNFNEVQNVISLKCNISIEKKKSFKEFKSEIKIFYPRWVTLELDEENEAIENNIVERELTIKPQYLFNSNIKDVESHEFIFKVAISHIKKYEGSIEAKLKKPKIKGYKINSNVQNFKIKIIEG
ncbi:hypothetical protein ABER96_03290 [Bacillus subtilis]